MHVRITILDITKLINMRFYITIVFMLRTDELDNIWELYGLKENPYSTYPILVLGGTIPLESFVGREEQISRLKKIIGSKGGSRTLVYGEVGVGKTSFVNVVRAQAHKKGFFTPFKEIAVNEEWDTDGFIANTLGAIYSSCKLLGSAKPLSNEAFTKLEHLFEIGRQEREIGVSIAGIGGNYAEKRITQGFPNSIMLTSLFQDTTKEICERTGKNVIIHYNNLELLPEKSLRRIFDNLRDFFQTPNVHFIFVGNLSVFSNVQSIPRFSSILTDTPIKVDNLTIEEIKQILYSRLEAMRIASDITYIVPHAENALQSLYDLYSGNIRNILNSLSTAVLANTKERAVSLDEYSLCITLKQVLEDRYLVKLKQRTKDVLLEIIKREEVTNKSIAENTKIARSNVSTYLSDLEKQGCIYLRRKNGKDKFWTAQPQMKWYILKVNEARARQHVLGEF